MSNSPATNCKTKQNNIERGKRKTQIINGHSLPSLLFRPQGPSRHAHSSRPPVQVQILINVGTILRSMYLSCRDAGKKLEPARPFLMIHHDPMPPEDTPFVFEFSHSHILVCLLVLVVLVLSLVSCLPVSHSPSLPVPPKLTLLHHHPRLVYSIHLESSSSFSSIPAGPATDRPDPPTNPWSIFHPRRQEKHPERRRAHSHTTGVPSSIDESTTKTPLWSTSLLPTF